MAVDSVTSSTNAQPVRPQVQPEQADRNDQAKKADQARQEERAKQARQSEHGGKAHPVVNTQGQTTGKIVNVKA